MKKLLPTSTTLSVNKKGFTLIELLVVISIIAILSVIGLTVFSGTQKNARDVKRRADVDAISKALEASYKTDTGYPVIDCAKAFSGGVCPKDPTSSTAYSGVPNTAGFSYEICADLEADGRDPDDLAPKDYCIKQQQ